MDSHLQSIIEKCHLANPKLLELTPGCKVNLGGFTGKTIIFADDYGFQTMGPGVIGGMEIGRTQKHLIQSVIGHPITLQDILLAMSEHKRGFYCILSGGNFYQGGREYEDGIVAVQYDLTKSPYDQEESVLEFISKNI